MTTPQALPKNQALPLKPQAPPATQPAPASPSGPASPSTLSAQNYAFLQHFIQTESGIVIDADKQYLLETRLSPLLKLHRLPSLDALSLALATRTHPTLSRGVIEAMTTHETLFFRDGSLFEALRKQVFPDFFASTHGTRPLRIWSAAASSGQEAYSLSMMLLEMGKLSRDFEIVGTDLSTQVLEKARAGRYGQFEVSRGLPMAMLVKYFKRAGLDWEVQPEAKRSVRFEQLDLRKDLRFLGEFDLILCRNVLIYFDGPTKTRILNGLRGAMRQTGLLALGCAETIINLHSGFRREVLQQSTFYARTEAR